MSRFTGLMLAAALVLACGVVMAQDNGKKAKKDGKAGNRAMGKITKVDGNTLTIQAQARKGGGETPAPRTITIDDATKILVQTGEMEPAAEGKRPMPKTKDGTKDDLKEGVNIMAQLGEGDKATQVTVLAARQGGDKGGKGKGKGDNGAKKAE